MRRASLRPIARAAGLAIAVLAGGMARAGAQVLPSAPLVLGEGRLTIGGGVSLTFSCANAPNGSACSEDTGFFNYTDYEHSLVRMARLDLNAAFRASEHVVVLAEVRSQNGSAPLPYALYVRLRPWRDRNFDIQAGRVPPTFGAFGRRTYAADNLLIGFPLGYQYLTSLRADAVPASADELLRMRGRGWLSAFSLGSPTPGAGVPLVAALRWDTGLQVHAGTSWVEGAASITAGSLAEPVLPDRKPGQQLSARVAVHPLAGLHAGVSAARGPFLNRSALRGAGAADRAQDSEQRALGADVEYSRDYYLVRAEVIRNTWTLPTINVPLGAVATSVEGRYKLTARLHAAARFDRLGFSTVRGTAHEDEWDAPVTRVEIGGGYLLKRNLQLKFSVQRNVRDGGRTPRLTLGAVQFLFWL